MLAELVVSGEVEGKNTLNASVIPPIQGGGEFNYTPIPDLLFDNMAIVFQGLSTGSLL